MLENLYPGGSVVLIGVVLLLDVLAIVLVWRGTAFAVVAKLLWSVVVLVVPFGGAIGWLIVWTIAKLVGSPAVR